MEANKHLTNVGGKPPSVVGVQSNDNVDGLMLTMSDAPMPFESFGRKVLYVYSIDDDDHIGMVKVGDTTIKHASLKGVHPNQYDSLAREAAHARIRQDLGGAHGVNIKYTLEFAEIVWKDPNNDFRDYAIHDILEFNGFERVKFPHSSAREWFKVEVETVRDAFEAYCRGYKSIDKSRFKVFIKMRDEQVDVRDNTLNARKNGEKERLWDCKPRFGKTTTAMSMLEESHVNPSFNPFQRVLVVTNRPDVEKSWFDEYEKMLKDKGWQFSSKRLGISFQDIDLVKPSITFMSLQDLKGKDKKQVNAFKASNMGVFSVVWDLIFIDEAHEGNDTILADGVHEELERDFTVYLSGTPFKYLASGRFDASQIDTWDYVQEQYAKENWDYSRGENPYRFQPKLWINAIDLSQETKELFSRGVDASAFDFNEFFKLNSDEDFVNKAYVESFAKRLRGEGEPKAENYDPTQQTLSEPHMPYSESFMDSTKHTLWVLPPNVKICKAFAKLLKEDEFFKDYEIIVAAGSDTKESKNALQTVQKAIMNNEKTITLTVGKLTTGVTVPEWTGVLMLTNMSSAPLYVQAIFRIQSPYEFEGKVKENVYVWDFAPDRVLEIISEVAGISSKANSMNSNSKRERLDEMLNFLPIIAYTSSGDFRKFNASEITMKIKEFHAERAINAGFETPLLFRKDLENLSPDMRQAIQELYLAAGKGTKAQEPKWEVVISNTGNAPPEYAYIEAEKEPELKPEPTEEELEARKKRQELLKERENMRNILYSASSRIPFILLAKMSDPEFKENLKLGNSFGFKELAESFDEESWKEFFGPISKELFISLEEAFDMDTTRGAILGWIKNVQDTLLLIESEPKEYAEHVYRFMGKIKNPNKETVFTPAEVAELVYEKAGLKTPESWNQLYLNGAEAVKQNRDPFPTCYDINTKSGIFPMYAANNLFQNSSGRTWGQVCDESIYANARTLAGKWATCSLLNMEQNWKNITVIDIHKELQSEDIKHLTDAGKRLFIEHFLLSPLNNKDNPEAVLSDITNKNEREKIIKIVEKHDRENKELDRAFEKEDMTKDAHFKAKQRLEAKIKEELNITKNFDFTISNPPYQMVTNSANGAATAIWQHFLIVSSEISKKIVMINPARWQKGGAGTGLLGIKAWLMENPHFSKVINLPAQEIFPTAAIAGDVSIEVIDNTKTFTNPKIGTWSKEKGWSELKDFILTDEIDIPLEDRDKEIVLKILSANVGENFEKEIWVGGQDQKTKKIASQSVNDQRADFGIMGPRLHRDTDYFVLESEKQPGTEYVKIWYGEKGINKLSVRYLPRTEFVDNKVNDSRIPKWKSLIPKTNAHFIYRNLGPVGEPNSLSTNTWLCRSFDSKEEVEGFNSYLQTYFYRYLVSIRNVTHNAYANVHRFVPDISQRLNPRTGKVGYQSDWIDDDLVEIFGDVLTPEDWCYIKQTAVTADKGRGDYESGWGFPDGSTRHSLTLPDDCDSESKDEV